MAPSDESDRTRPWPAAGSPAHAGGTVPPEPATEVHGPVLASSPADDRTTVVVPTPGGPAGVRRPPVPPAARPPHPPTPPVPPSYRHGAGPGPRGAGPGGPQPWVPYPPSGRSKAAHIPVPPPPQPGFGDFGFPSARPRSGKVRVIIAAAGVATVVVAAVLVMGFWVPGFFTRTELDVTQAQNNIQVLLSDDVSGYGPGHVRDVVCNQGRNPLVEKDATFVCAVSIDGVKREITATFQDDKGAYQISLPQ